MVNDLKNQISIDSIRKQLHRAAACPPREEPFSRAGAQAWEEYTAICRGYEAELIEAGVQL